MKIHIAKLFVSIFFAILVSIPAFAQSGGTFRAHIPFDFYINKQKLAAGDYFVTRPIDTTRSVVRIQNREGKQGTLVLGRVGSFTCDPRGANATLVFKRYGPTYLLSEIRDPWRDEITSVPTAMDKVLSAKRPNSTDETVLVALN